MAVRRRWVDVKAIAWELGCSVESVRRGCRAGRWETWTLPGGKGWRVLVDELGRPVRSG